MKAKKFISGNGQEVTTSDKSEIKMFKACGWREVKSISQTFAKGLQGGKNYFN